MQDLKRIRYSTLLNLFILSLILVLANIYEASAQRRGGGGGGGARHSVGARGGGGAANRGAQMSNRGGSQARGGQAVQRGGGQARSGVSAGTADRGSAGAANRGGAGTANRDVGAGNRGDNINSNRNTNTNRNNNINVDNDINIDADGGWDNDWDYHPIAAGVAFGTAAAVTSAAIGSMYYSLPPSCAPRPYNSVSYYYCGNAWYQPAYSGTSVTYTVVNAPY